MHDIVPAALYRDVSREQDGTPTRRFTAMTESQYEAAMEFGGIDEGGDE